MKTTEIVLHVPEISLSAVASAYIDVVAFLFALAALSYICFRAIAPYIKNEEGIDLPFVWGGNILLVVLALVPVAFVKHICNHMNTSLIPKERLEELEEKEEAYNDYFGVDEDEQ